MRLYLTHCSKEKDPRLKHTSIAVTPEHLYTNAEIQQFMRQCQICNVHWAILSDLYGIFFSDDQHIWYEKHPDTVTPAEEARVIEDFNQKLSAYEEIHFWVRPASFHPFYARVLQKTALADRIITFQDLAAIELTADNAKFTVSLIHE